MIEVIDLFSGAGGLTLGFNKKIINNKFVNRKKFKVRFANEFDEMAVETFKKNFPNIKMIDGDIAQINKKFLIDNKISLNEVDLIIGGPPCQSYSTVGKRQYDNRAKMYREYRRMLSIFKPKMFIFENVLGLLTMKNSEGNPVIDDVEKSFINFSDFNINLGYTIHKKVLNAVDFGVPQNRERVFLVGIRNDLEIKKDFVFPKGKSSHISLGEAIGDLPILSNGLCVNEYSEDSRTNYQKLIRNGSKKLNNHQARNHGKRIQKIIESLPEGKDKDYINNLVDRNLLSKSLYLTSGYKNTYARLWWDRPSTTITNNLSTPSSLRCIHPTQNRALTSREGARIQSFPDTFEFVGSKTKINSQIGNAVPPILAMAIANQVEQFFIENKLGEKENE